MARVISALPPKADIAKRDCYVRFVPVWTVLTLRFVYLFMIKRMTMTARFMLRQGAFDREFEQAAGKRRAGLATT